MGLPLTTMKRPCAMPGGIHRAGLWLARRTLLTSVARAKKPNSLVAAQFDDVRRRLAKEAVRRDAKHLIETCRLTKKTVRKHPKSPIADEIQRHTYELLLSVLAERGLARDAMFVLEDIEASPVPLTPTAHEYLVEAAKIGEDAQVMEMLLRRAGSPEAPAPASSSLLAFARWTPKAYAHALEFCAKTNNLELALALWFTARDMGVAMEDEALFALLQCLDRAKEPRLAFELVQAHGTQTPAVWMEVLRIAAQCAYAPVLAEAWKRTSPLQMDEGLYLQMLLSAARAADAELIAALQRAFYPLCQGTKLQSYHLAPALEGYCRAGRLDDALTVVHRWMRLPDDPGPDPKALIALTEHAASSDAALTSTADTVLRDKRPLPTVVANAVLYAAAERASMPVALQVWEAATRRKAFVPDLDTHQAFLLCCIATGDTAAADRVWKSMARRKLTPTASLYERMARLYLRQLDYEEAFANLERVKELDCVPSRRTYAAMVWTCLVHEDPRWKALVQEMQEAGYELGERLRAAVDARALAHT